MMDRISRRQFLKYLATGGVAVGASSLYGYHRWQTTVTAASLPSFDIYSKVETSQTGPFLVVTNRQSDNPFGLYLAEILRAEGWSLFQTVDLSDLDAGLLQSFALAFLAEGPLETSQVSLLEAYVTGGGRLIAMRPDPQLAGLLGLEMADDATLEGYFRVDPDHPAAQGIVDETLQFHGEADHYRPVEAEVVAELYQDAATPADYPAITLRRQGQGWASAWAFDLAHSVVYTRQGNPDWANQERDGADGIRAHDMFVDWIDLERIAIPQADEAMRLLSGLITAMSADLMPLPRLWTMPDASQAMLVVTGDDHSNPASHVETVLDMVEAHGGAMSIYYSPPPPSSNLLRRTARLVVHDLEYRLNPTPTDPGHLPTPAEVANWRSRGHEFNLHPYVDDGLEAGYRTYAETFRAEGYGQVGGTVRTHRILWTGWVETAKTQAAHGFGMNLDFYHIGPSFQTPDGRWVHGYFTGSGLPMRMVDTDGQIVDNYQLLTELIDEHLLFEVNAGWEKLNAAKAVAISQQMIDNALKYHTILATQFHLDFYYPTSPLQPIVREWAAGTLAYAAEKGLPIWSAGHLLDFVRCREKASFEQVDWDEVARRLRLELHSEERDDFALTILVPAEFGAGSIEAVSVDGQPADFAIQAAYGREAAWISIKPGNHTIEIAYAAA